LRERGRDVLGIPGDFVRVGRHQHFHRIAKARGDGFRVDPAAEERGRMRVPEVMRGEIGEEGIAKAPL
jgi:hypothetical protein